MFRRTALGVILLMLFTLAGAAQTAGSPTGSNVQIFTTNPSAQAVPARSQPASDLAAADQLFAVHKLPEAAARYAATVRTDPKSIPAQIGLVRSNLVMRKLDEALAAAKSALAVTPNSAQLLATLGDVQYRMGMLPEAERSYIKAENANANSPESYLGLAAVYRAYSLDRRAYECMKRAHQVAPDNIPVQLMWVQSLPAKDQIPELESYLRSPGINPRVAGILQQYLTRMKNTAAIPQHACRLVSNVRQTDTKLYPIARGQTSLAASGVAVKINKQDMRLALDTGASGILLGRTSAEKLGLERLGFQPIVGMGDSGAQGGYVAVADRIRVGDLEFQDCMVKVTEAATPVTGQDGLIGTDVFNSYLIDIDIPSAKLRLSPLPKRPNQAEEPAALNTTSAAASGDVRAGADSQATVGATDLPTDAYVAPEMANWSKAYRMGSLLLIPTKVDDVGPLLFLLDTGSFSNILSPRAAAQVTQIRSDPNTHVKGLGGDVSKIYRADQATLAFGRYEQEAEGVVTFDLSAISQRTGTEVSGILGFAMLRILQTKIDYRDGLVDFVYDPSHLPKHVRILK